MKLRGTLAALAAMSVLALGGQARAGTHTTTFGVTATVNANCNINSANAIAFGTYDPTQSTVQQSGSISVTCSSGDSISIALDNGQHAGLATYSCGALSCTRAMHSAATGQNLGYDIFTTSGYGTVWNATNTVDFTGGGNTATVSTTYGQLPTGQYVQAGSDYTDTVTATVNY